MSGYDLRYSDPFRLSWHRLNGGNKEDFKKHMHNRQILDSELSSVRMMEQTLGANGGNVQQDRMIFDKRRSLDRALKYSYQSAKVRKAKSTYEVSDKPKNKPLVAEALINPDKNKKSYDDKIISINWEHQFKVGDVFEWLGTGTYWLIYLQDLTELAYFRGDVRRCSYEIEWEDENGKHSTYATIQGPQETRIDSIQKHGISVDNPNLSITMMMPKTEENLKYFKRYSKFYLQEDFHKICWRVEAIDWISTPGIISVIAVEYFANETEDDIENGIVGGLKVKDIKPENNSEISGELFIKPKKVYQYEYSGNIQGQWKIDKKCPAKIAIDTQNSKKIQLVWDSSYSGTFTLSYGDCSITIVVESLF